MKLFIWNEPYPVRYGSSILFAVAETEEAARSEVTKNARFFSYGTEDAGLGWPEDETTKLGTPRIVELPCAEFHQWSE